MAKKKYNFPGLDCPQCPFHQTVGGSIDQTRYCNGFPKKRKPKRFRRSDPKYKPPKWCPRRISPTVCRIYGFADRDSEMTDWLLGRESHGHEKDAYIFAVESRYRLRLEVPLGMTAKQFYDAAQSEFVDGALSNVDVEHGEIIEIDDGLKPYYFYYVSWAKVIPVLCFDRSKTKKPDPLPAGTGGGQP